MSKPKTAVVALIVVIAAALASTLGFFFFRDNFSTHYPVKAISATDFRAGEIPYWNFYDGGGQPLAGNPNTLTFYPDNVLYLLLPAHVAFNLHFILHLAAAWLAMRALSRSPWAAWLYVASGVAISATAFYNLIVAVAAVPYAFWAAERRRPLHLGVAFGLLGLAAEPVTVIAAAIGVAIIAAPRFMRLLAAVPVAILVASPQLIAYAEIAREVERARGFSAQTVLNASLAPLRLLEILVGPFFPVDGPQLFLSLFIGVIAIPALLQRSRYTAIALIALFFALGAYNPLVRIAVEQLPAIRIIRFPEKFAIVMTAAIVVLAARFLENRIWRLVTLIPVAIAAIVTIPIDLFAPYDAPQMQPMRVFAPRSPGGQSPDRADYHARARRLEPTFGAVSGIRYAVDRSPDGMFSLGSRVAAERLQTTRNELWLRIAGCVNVRGALPRAMFVGTIAGAATIGETVNALESPQFDEQRVAVGPQRYDGLQSPSAARVIAVAERPQVLEIRVITPARAVLFVNETYFSAWDAGGLETFPLDLDRLGVMVPAGEHTITLRFGKHRTAVFAAWAVSLLLLVTAAAALRIEILNRRTGEIERAAHENRPVA
jgi:hypothetical protein